MVLTTPFLTAMIKWVLWQGPSPSLTSFSGPFNCFFVSLGMLSVSPGSRLTTKPMLPNIHGSPLMMMTLTGSSRGLSANGVRLKPSGLQLTISIALWSFSTRLKLSTPPNTLRVVSLSRWPLKPLAVGIHSSKATWTGPPTGSRVPSCDRL